MKQGAGMGASAERLKRRQIPPGCIALAVLLIVLMIIPFALKERPYYVHIFITIFLWGYLATAWGLVGQSGQLSFGHAAFMGVAAYTTGVLFGQFGINPWLGMWVGVILATIGGLIIGYPSLRLRGVYFALATFAFAFILQMFVRNTLYLGPVYIGAGAFLSIPQVSGGNAPGVFQFASKTPYYFIALFMLAGVVTLSYLLNRSRLGYYWRAMRSDPDAAESLGINVGKYRLITFLVSCALTGLGGAFFMQYFRFINPVRALDVTQSIRIALIGIVGGWQSVFGPMIGGFIITPIAELLRLHLGKVPALSPIIYGIVLMLFILFMPRGLNGPVLRGVRWIEAKLRRSAESGNDKPRR